MSDRPAKRWEAGDLGCGQMAAELKRRLAGIEQGESLEVVTRDPGAPVDVPAWCRLTGHELVAADPPTFVIRRRSD